MKKENKRTVFHFLNTGNYSGAENVAINIALLVDNFEHVYVSPSGTIDGILQNFGIKHIVVNKLTSKSMFQVIKNYHPDIVHAHDFRASIFAAKKEKYIHRYGGILISHIHNNDPRMRRIGILSLLYSWSIPKFDKILVVSESVVSEYIFKNYMKQRNEIIVLKNVINEHIILRKASMSLVSESDLIFVGRLVEQKNPIMFLKLVKLIVKEIPNLKVKIVGDGPLKNEVKNFIFENKLTNNVEVLGFVVNPYPDIKLSKIGVSTSQWEGFGLSILEQQLLGNPVIATPVGGIVNLVNEEVGLLSNSIQEMSIEIIKLLDNKEYLLEKSCRARKNVKKINNISNFQYVLRKVYGN